MCAFFTLIIEIYQFSRKLQSAVIFIYKMAKKVKVRLIAVIDESYEIAYMENIYS